MRNRVEALCRAMCLPSFTTITLRTQVKNNLSWLLGGFAQKYWAISIKLSARHLREEIWHLNRRETGTGMTISNLAFHLQASAVEENQSNSAEPKRRLVENEVSLWFPETDLVLHVKGAFRHIWLLNFRGLLYKEHVSRRGYASSGRLGKQTCL